MFKLHSIADLTPWPSIPAIPADRPARSALDVLEEIELRVARRADEIARGRQTHSAIDLDCWLLAEAEVLRHSTLFPERNVA